MPRTIRAPPPQGQRVFAYARSAFPRIRSASPSASIVGESIMSPTFDFTVPLASRAAPDALGLQRLVTGQLAEALFQAALDLV
jgi:hypothetical protein